jgi:hypothetical protein
MHYSHGFWCSLFLLGVGCAPPTISPSIELLFPTSTEDIEYCSDLFVVVDVDSLSISAAHYDGTPVAGEGHWHLYIDGDLIKTVVDNWTLMTGLEDGLRSVVVSLHENDHALIEVDGVTFQDTVEIEVADGEGCVGAPFEPDTGGA